MCHEKVIHYFKIRRCKVIFVDSSYCDDKLFAPFVYFLSNLLLQSDATTTAGERVLILLRSSILWGSGWVWKLMMMVGVGTLDRKMGTDMMDVSPVVLY